MFTVTQLMYVYYIETDGTDSPQIVSKLNKLSSIPVQPESSRLSTIGNPDAGNHHHPQ